MAQSTTRVRLGRGVLAAAVAASGAVVLGGASAAQAAPVPAPIITRFAGTGAFGNPTAGPAASTPLQEPAQSAFDTAGDVYIADDTVVVKVTPAGQLTVIAGDGTSGRPTPGPATSSPLGEPNGIGVDAAGNVYIADYGSYVIEKVTPAGVLSIYAGTGTAGDAVPGPATASPLYYPSRLAVTPAGVLYVTDYSNRAYKITPAGVLSVIAGNGTTGTAVPGPATASPLGSVDGAAVDPAGNVYLADTADARVDKVSPAGVLSVVAGTGTSGAPTPGPAGASELVGPAGVGVNTAGDVFIADTDYQGQSRVEQVTPAGVLSVVAGLGPNGAPTYGGPAAASALDAPVGADVNPAGVLYIADYDNHTVDRIGFATPTAPTGLTVTPGDTTAELSFTPGDPGTSAVTGYEVSVDGGRTFTAVSTAAGPGGTRTAHLTGLTDGTTYPVQVREVNGSGDSPASDTARVTPRAAVTAPGAPTGVTATPGVHSLTVRWHAPAQAGTPALTGYTVTITDRTTGARRTVHVGRILSATVPGLTAGDPYTATVTATTSDRTGPPSASSAPATPTAPPAPPTPTPAPKPTVHAPALAVVGLRTARLPVTCQVTTGRVTACAVTLTARINGRTVIVGTGTRTVSTATRHVTIAVSLTRAGRVLAARVGGLPTTVTAVLHTAGRTRGLVATTRTRVVTVVTVDPQPLHFTPASAKLTAADRAELTALRHSLGGVRAVVCAGYTDTVGDGPYNTRLGLARARNTCAYLIAGTHLKAGAVSFGETHPAATNRTPAGRAANRRALVALDH